MNRLFQEYKECSVEFVDELDLGFSVRVAEFKIEPEQKKEKYNRAKVKREFRKRIEEELEKYEGR